MKLLTKFLMAVTYRVEVDRAVRRIRAEDFQLTTTST